MLRESDTNPPEKPPPIPDLDFNGTLQSIPTRVEEADGCQLNTRCGLKGLTAGQQRHDRREADNDVGATGVNQGCNVILV